MTNTIQGRITEDGVIHWADESTSFDPMPQSGSKIEQPLRAADIARTAADLVGGSREHLHGTKQQNFTNIARLWRAYFENKGYPVPIDAVDVGNLQELMKVARRQHGAHNLDDYIDGAGYAACAGEIAEQMYRRSLGQAPAGSGDPTKEKA